MASSICLVCGTRISCRRYSRESHTPIDGYLRSTYFECSGIKFGPAFIRKAAFSARVLHIGEVYTVKHGAMLKLEQRLSNNRLLRKHTRIPEAASVLPVES